VRSVGVLGIQGAASEHAWMLRRCGARAVTVTFPAQLDGLDGLVIPGGESTTVGRLMAEDGFVEPIRRMALAGTPIFGTCAGLILLAREVVGPSAGGLALMDIVARRNAFGRQRESFEADLPVEGIDGGPFRCVFIRAPYIESAGPGVVHMGTCDGKVVMARQGNLLAAAFHPELTDDPRIHRYFMEMIDSAG